MSINPRVEAFACSQLNHTAFKPFAGNALNSVITSDDFERAINEITSWDGYAPTLFHQLDSLAAELNLKTILLKDEGERFGLGSFKALGGSYAGLRLVQRELKKRLGKEISTKGITSGKYLADASGITIVSATDGNHGRSLAWGTKRFGAACKIYIHAEVSELRAQAMRDLGAEVIRIDGDYDMSIARSRKDAEENGWFVVSDTSWQGYSQSPIDVMAGYGVMSYEINQQLQQAPTHVFLQAGVGGLAASVAAALRQFWGESSPRVILVEPQLAPCLYASAKARKITNVVIEDETIMAGLSCGEPSELAWQILSEQVQDFLTIPDSLIAPAMRLAGKPLGNDPAIVIGESGVAGLAALITAAQQHELRNGLNLNQDSRVLIIGSEGATDLDIYQKIMAG